ncbi:MAG TPA: hypothetical protein VGP72_24020 [Planctomycetota bacterium]|jgi:hypothetical protein
MKLGWLFLVTLVYGAMASAEESAVLENKVLLLSASVGRQVVMVGSKLEGASKRLELAIVPEGAKESAAITKAERIKNEAGKDVLRIAAGAAEADLAVNSAGFVTVTPGKNAGCVEVRAGARYAVLPDFFADDVVLDPVKLTVPMLNIPAENFLLQFIEGGSSIVMCIWPGNLKLGAAAPAGTAGQVGSGTPTAERQGPEPQVDLVFSGEGNSRRISAARIEFQGKPVFVGLIEQKNVWQDEEVSGKPAYKPLAISWKPPFQAKWRGDFIVAEGKTMADWPTRHQSFDFQSTTAARPDKWWERGTDALDARFAAAASNSNPHAWIEKGGEDAPQIWQESLAAFFIYPAFFKGDETRLCLYADKSERAKAKVETAAARKANKDAPEVSPPNVYERVLIYPLNRTPATPLNVYTPVDLMRQTLGTGPCEYVLDIAGVKPRAAGGDRPILSYATCGLWNDHIKPIAKGLKKKADGSFEPLDAPTKAHLIQALEEMWHFVHAVHDRLREYKQWSADAAAFCDRAAAQNAKVKSVVDKVQTHIAKLNVDIGRHKFDGPGSEAYWKDRVPELIAQVKADNYAGVESIGKIRDLGNDQDERVSRCRQYVKAARQEILMQDTSDPDVRKFAAEFRDRCHQMLRNMHPKEGF